MLIDFDIKNDHQNWDWNVNNHVGHFSEGFNLHYQTLALKQSSTMFGWVGFYVCLAINWTTVDETGIDIEVRLLWNDWATHEVRCLENYLSILDGMGTSFMTGSKGLKDQQKERNCRLARLWKTWKHCRPSSVFFARRAPTGLVLLEDARNFQIRWWQSKKICKAGLRPWFLIIDYHMRFCLKMFKMG
jgi:hypothetical protein